MMNLTKEQKTTSYINRAEAIKYFKSTGEWFEGCDLHHIDSSWKENDVERYIQWNPEDLLVLTRAEHQRLHHIGKPSRHTGYKLNKRSRDKVSKNTGRKVICIETGEIYNSANEAAKAVNISLGNLSHVLNGVQKTAAGYHWVYEEDK